MSTNDFYEEGAWYKLHSASDETFGPVFVRLIKKSINCDCIKCKNCSTNVGHIEVLNSYGLYKDLLPTSFSTNFLIKLDEEETALLVLSLLGS